VPRCTQVGAESSTRRDRSRERITRSYASARACEETHNEPNELHLSSKALYHLAARKLNGASTSRPGGICQRPLAVSRITEGGSELSA
jgi:hypothetical protein